MRMAHDFAPARAAAQHCAALLARAPRPEERTALIDIWRRDLARMLTDNLSALLAGDRLAVSVSAPEALRGKAVLERIGTLAVNSLLRCGESGETALLSVDFATAIALTDRSFGGEGKYTGETPEQLPLSAALLVDEAAAAIAQAITRASFGDAPIPADGRTRGAVIVRSESAARLKPFAADAPCLLFAIIIANQQGCEWRTTLALTAERMERLLPGAGRPPRPRTALAPASGMAAPFAAIPLPLQVVVAECNMSLARLKALAPGDCIPLTMGRQVPLKLGERVLAHGTIGTSADRMAIRLIRLPDSGPTTTPALQEGFVP